MYSLLFSHLLYSVSRIFPELVILHLILVLKMCTKRPTRKFLVLLHIILCVCSSLYTPLCLQLLLWFEFCIVWARDISSLTTSPVRHVLTWCTQLQVLGICLLAVGFFLCMKQLRIQKEFQFEFETRVKATGPVLEFAYELLMDNLFTNLIHLRSVCCVMVGVMFSFEEWLIVHCRWSRTFWRSLECSSLSWAISAGLLAYGWRTGLSGRLYAWKMTSNKCTVAFNK